MMMPKGVTPTRVRRRQSDAKWRASVAMCYNIMKNVIPNQKKLGRRKVSKALTLKETERHIVNLERKLKEIIEDRAPMSGKVVMVEREDKSVYPATFEDIKKDFALKQHSFFASTSGNGKKRYNIPADIEASLENLSQQSCRLVIVNRAHVKSTPSALPKSFKSASKKCDLNQFEHHSFLQNLLESTENCQETTIRHRTPSKRVQTYIVPAQQSLTPCQPIVRREATPGTPSVKGDHPLNTPLRKCSQSVIRTGFTPVKLPSGLECKDVLLSFPTTPAKSTIGSPFSNFSLPQTPGSCFNGYFEFTDDETSSNLLCTESIDFEDLSRDWSPKPEKRSPILLTRKTSKGESRSDLRVQSSPERRELKCRRKLEEQYKVEDQADHLVPAEEDIAVQDLDGYLLFYEDDSGLVDSSDGKFMRKDGPLVNLLDSLGCYDDKPGYSGIVSLDCGPEDSNGLSADLVGLDIKPFHKFHINTDFSSSAESYHEVPGYDLSGVVTEKDSFSSDLVPELDHFRDPYGGNSSQSQGADSDQVVPEIRVT